jgi:hypothetical protein
MVQTHVSAERILDAPADVVYHCIADYREHHRPEGFLPPAFTDFEVQRGGAGAGTVIRFASTLGGRKQTLTATITSSSTTSCGPASPPPPRSQNASRN